jgi:hypothetical protein
MKEISMVKFIFFACFLVISSNSYSQTFSEESSDLQITPYIDGTLSNLPNSSSKLVENKLKQIVTRNGLGADGQYPRFILTPSVDLIDKQVTPTAPPMVAITLDITLYLGDGIEGVLFDSFTKTVKGVGNNEQRAYTMALNKLNPRDREFSDFLESSKEKINIFYENKCKQIIEESKNKAQRGLYDEAIYDLFEVPSIAKSCYSETLELALSITKQKLEAQCQSAISKSKGLVQQQNWSGAIAALNGFTPGLSCYSEIEELYQTISKEKCNSQIAKARSSYSDRQFSEAAKTLASIPANSSCSENANALLSTIKNELDEQAQKEWDLAYEKYDRDQTLKEEGAALDRELARRQMAYQENQGAEIRKLEIEAAKAIGVAYGKNQPRNVTYNVNGW